MTTALVILGVLAALFLAAALATRDSQALAPAPPDAADVVLPERVGADDVRGLRFGLAARGYRMSEVDAALERLAAELEDRERRIAELTGEVPVPDIDAGPVEVDGIATAGLGSAGAGMDPLLPSVPAPGADRAHADAPQGTSTVVADGLVAPASATPASATAAADVPAVRHGDDAFAGASDVPVAARAGSAPDVALGQVPSEPVDPPVRRV